MHCEAASTLPAIMYGEVCKGCVCHCTKRFLAGGGGGYIPSLIAHNLASTKHAAAVEYKRASEEGV